MPNEVPFFSQTAVLDRYIHLSNPAGEPVALGIIIEVLRTKRDLRRWFFTNRPHSSWAKVLLDHGFFDEPPPPIASDGRFFLTHWDVQDYLISVASEVPDVVLAHFERIRTNKKYLRSAVMALCLIPMELANQAVPKLLESLTDPATAFTIAEQAFELMKKLAEAGFALFEALPSPQPSPRAKKANHEILDDYVYNAEAVSFLPTDDYNEENLWKPGLEELARLDLKRLVLLLEKQLIQALQVEAETRRWSEETQRDSFWRVAIEDTGQDISDEYKDFLLKLLREFSERYISQQPDEAVALIDDYLNQDYEILKRLSIYLLGQFPQQYRDRVRDILLNAENMDDVKIHHEYFSLLESGYPHLEKVDQRRLNEMILSGPTPEKLAEVSSWANKDDGEDPEEYARGYTKYWRQKRLWMIRNHLQDEVALELQKLTTELGEPDHPDFTRWSTGVDFISTVSPVDDNELRSMTVDRLLTFLREWKPSDRRHEFKQESYGALGQIIAQVVFSDYQKYGDHLGVLARLNPEYATSFINCTSSSNISSDEMLRIKMSLGEEILADETIRNDRSRSYEGGWIGFRLAIVQYLESLFNNDSPLIPTAELPRVRDLLILLTDDPDPLPEADQPAEGWAGHKDPITVALNHVSPKALSTLIRYASYKANLDMAEDRRGFGPKRLEPKVRQILTRKVHFQLNRTISLHSIFGQQFNRLCWLDWDWAVEYLSEIFPEGNDEMSVAFFVAAWDSFVIFNQQVYGQIFSLLHPKYERGIELHKQSFNTQTHLDPVRHFAAHLVVEYLYADYSLNSPEGQSSLLARFFNETTPQLRATAARSAVEVFTNISKNAENSDRLWPRMRALWQWRLEEAASNNHPSDFDGEMQSFSGLLRIAAKRERAASLWPLLEGMLHYIARSERRDMVWWNFEQYLLLEVERDPVKAIQIFRLMHDQSEAPHSYYRDEARKIIEVGAQRAESRHDALLLMEQIARSGNYTFTSVYEKYVNGEIR
jgi:hypothetical protein